MESRSTKVGETTDELGRARFHGAFTGGFSAGYFNSVGSKEGWQPKTFSSSRSNRADYKAQETTDFQDAEDQESEMMEGKQIATLSQFSSFDAGSGPSGGVAENLLKGGDLSGGLASGEKSVGWRLLKQMGWSVGDAVGAKRIKRKKKVLKVAEPPPVPAAAGKHVFTSKKKVYGVAMPQGGMAAIEQAAKEEAEDAAAAASSKRMEHAAEKIWKMPQKTDFNGLGYDRFSQHGDFGDMSAQRAMDKAAAVAADIKEHHEGPVKKGTAFGLGALEEKDKYDDCYEMPSMSEFDTELITEGEAARKAKEARGKREQPRDVMVEIAGGGSKPAQFKSKGLWSRFHISTTLPQKKKVFAPPKIPAGWAPFHRFNEIGQDAANESARREQMTDIRAGLVNLSVPGLRMDASKRASILGEKPLPPAPPILPPGGPPPGAVAPVPTPPTVPHPSEGFHPDANLLKGGMPNLLMRVPADQLKKLQDAAKKILNQGSNAYVPYPNDIDKHQRYEQFLRDMGGRAPEGFRCETDCPVFQNCEA